MFYHVVKERQRDHLQLLGQRPVIPLAAPACKCGLPADIDLIVTGGIDHDTIREADRNKADR